MYVCVFFCRPCRISLSFLTIHTIILFEETEYFYLWNIQGVAIMKPDSCSNPLFKKKKSDNRNVIPFNVVPSPVPTPLHVNFPLLEAVLQVILCYAVQELHRFCFHCIHGLEPGSFERRLDFREEKKSHGARSGEYGGCSITGMLFYARYLFTDSALCAGALS